MNRPKYHLPMVGGMESEVDRRKFLTGVGAVATTALAGCSGGGGGTDTETDPSSGSDGGDTEGTDESMGGTESSEAEGGELQMLTNPAQSLDPAGATGSKDDWVIWQTHESLFRYEEGTVPVTGHLATDYSVSEDYTTYTFTLKEGVTFHDGSELTAADVVYSWRRLAESDNNRGNTDEIINGVVNVVHEETEEGELVPDSLAIEAVDDYTVEVTLEQPFHGTLGQMAQMFYSVVPEGIVGDIEGYEGEYDYETWSTEEVTGTGPFQLETWNSGSEVVVTAFEDYHGSVANIDGIRWQVVEDPNARYTRAVNEQNADIFEVPRSQFNPDLVERSEELEGRTLGSYGPVSGTTLNYGEAAIPQTQFLQCNTINVEKPARVALAYAINQEAVIDQATKGLGEPAYFVSPPVGFPGGEDNYDQLAQEEYPYGYAQSDIQSAREVMEEAGYGPDNMYETAMQIKSDTRASIWESVASYIRDIAQSVHIDLSIEAAPSSTLVNRAIEGDIDIFGNYMDLSWIEADSGLQYTRPTPAAWTRWGQGEDGMTDAAERADEAWTDLYLENRIPTEEAQEARNEAYLTMERANWEDVTLIPLWNPTNQLYWYDWVEGFDYTGPLRRTAFNDISIGDRA